MRKLIFLLLSLGFIAALAYLGSDQLRLWNQRKLSGRAVSAAQKGDYSSAVLFARQVLQANPGNAPMCRLIAEIADAAGSPEAILWWSRTVKSDGGKFNDIANLVSSALRNDETAVAGEALDQVHEPDRKLLSYHLLMGGYAAVTGQLAVAESEFSQAAILKPEDKSIQLNLASVHLQSNTPETVISARAELEKLKEDPALRPLAMRALLSDARIHKNPEKALQIARDLATGADATFQDQLAWLEETERSSGANFNECLKIVQQKTGRNPSQIRQLVHWMNVQAMAEQSLVWIRSLPLGLQSNPTVQFAAAESMAALGKWEELRVMLVKESWEELDFLRFAIQARAARETMHTSEFAEKWERAIIATNGDVRMQSMLVRLVSGWSWTRESEQIWWLIAKHVSGQRAALQSLYKLYSDAKNTPQLYRVIMRVYESDPDDALAINNMAAVSLLLGKNLELAQRLAKENYSKFPNNPAAASTYAYSLYCQNKSVEGLKVLGAFPEETLRKPAIAAYYGLLLASTGEHAKAGVYLDIAVQSKELLPEETALVTRARQP